MAVDERVVYLERRMEDHSALIADVRVEMRDLRAEMRDLRADMDRRFDRVDQKFTWLVGMFMALLLALLGLSVQVARLQPV